MRSNDPFSALFGAMTAEIGGLLTCLREETDVLADPQTVGLEALIERKQAALQRVSDLEQERQRRCLELGLDHSSKAMADYCLQHSETLNSTWQQILDALEKCQAQNLTNGSMLALRQRFATGALAVLRGNNTLGETYLPSGARTQPGVNRRYLQA